MGILNNSVSICQFQVVGNLPSDNLTTFVGSGLSKNGFRSIEQSSEEKSIGWVELSDFQSSEFADEQSFAHDHYFAFSLRRDQRKLPAALVKPYIEKNEADWLAQNPKYRRVPKQQREDLRDAVRASLFAKTLPTPTVYDVVWDSRSNLITFTSLGTAAIDLLVEHFHKSFSELRLVPLHPMARAEQVIDAELKEALKQANQSRTDKVLEQIEANQWLGNDFLFWLMHQTMDSASEYSINQPGPAVNGDGFVAYLNDRMQLAASGENGVQKVTVTGPQDHFSEVKTALQSGKQIFESVLHLEQLEQSWKMTFKGESFHFASFKAPPVKIEKDDSNDPALEKQAVFYERMHLLESGLQLFDSLFATFLKERLATSWGQKEQAIRNYLEAA